MASSRRVAVAALACMSPLHTQDRVASLALPNGIVRVDDEHEIKGAERAGGRAKRERHRERERTREGEEQ